MPAAGNRQAAFRAATGLDAVGQDIENLPADEEGPAPGTVGVFQIMPGNIAQVNKIEALACHYPVALKGPNSFTLGILELLLMNYRGILFLMSEIFV